MKILFYVKSIGDAHLAHALAEMFRERAGATHFAGVVYRDSGEGYYLKNETEGWFNPVLGESEMYDQVLKDTSYLSPEILGRLEREYGIPTLWQYVIHDRWLWMHRNGYIFEEGSRFTREQMLGQVQTRFLRVEQLFDKFQPDIVIYAGPDVAASLALIVSQVAAARKIPVLMPKFSKVGSFFAIEETPFSRMPRIERRFREIRSGATSPKRDEAFGILNEFRQGGLSPYFMNPKRLNGKGTAPSLQRLGTRVVKQSRKILANDPLYVSWLRRQYDKGLIRLRTRQLRSSPVLSHPIPGEKYVFFPLHLIPELSILLYAPFYTNQAATIQNIAQSLPFDTCLYVKEHPSAVGRRPLDFYQGLTRLPNIRVISNSHKSYELIKNSQGVVTITGTAGLEAMLLGKPVITLGDVYYNFVSELVSHTPSFQDLPLLIRKFEGFQSDDSMIVDFLSALLDETISVKMKDLATTLTRQPRAEWNRNAELERYGNELIRRIQELQQVNQVL